MKTIAIHIQKGGVGKTSLAGAIAYELSLKGKTLIIDNDPQGNISSWLVTSEPKYELANVLYGKVELSKAITAINNTNIDILPTFGIDGELKLFGENQLASEPFIFCDLMEEIAKLGYAYVVIDLSPGIGRLEKAATIAADEIVAPMTPETFSLDGIEIFVNELNKTKKSFKRGPNHDKIVVNAFDNRIEQHITIHNEANKKNGYKIFTIPVDPVFRKAQADNIPIQAMPKGKGAKTTTINQIKFLTEALCH